MTQEKDGERTNTKQQERAERILDATAELLVRWGYRRVTIDDIAKQAEVGSGTIYLHWKTRDALFETLVLREAVTVWRELQRRIADDSEEVLIHRMMRSMLMYVMSRPLARALFTGDSELLGKMTQSHVIGQTSNMAPPKEFIRLLRDLGLLRTDMDLAQQTYAFGAMITGFCLYEPLLTEEEQIPLEEKGDALARFIQLALEPETLPSPEMLREKVIPVIMAPLEQICLYCEQQIQQRMM